MDYFGIREVCEVTLRSLRNIPACRSMTGKAIKKGEPVMYFDYLKVSNISGSVSTVYATGGRGNTRRLSWDGDKEITFHIEDALISPTSMAILTAAQMVRRRINRTELTGAGINFTWDATTGINVITIDPATTNFDPQTFVDWAIINVAVAEFDLDTAGSGDYSLPSTSTTPLTETRLKTKDIEVIKRITSAPGVVPVTTEYDLIIDTTQIDPLTGVQRALEITGIAPLAGGLPGFQMLTATAGKPVFKHEKYTVNASIDGEIQLRHNTIRRDANHPLFVFDVHDDGSIDLLSDIGGIASGSGAIGLVGDILRHPDIYAGNDYLVDYYREVKGNVTSLIITADGTSDYYKLEGETLMRREADGMDVPVVITIPKVRPRAQFEIPMSSTGDPATFSFDFDVFPARDSNYAGCNDNVMVVIDIIEDDDNDDCNCVFDGLDL